MNLTELKSWIKLQLNKPGVDYINWQEIESNITKDQFNLTKNIIGLFNQSVIYGQNNNSKIKLAYNILEKSFAGYHY